MTCAPCISTLDTDPPLTAGLLPRSGPISGRVFHTAFRTTHTPASCIVPLWGISCLRPSPWFSESHVSDGRRSSANQRDGVEGGTRASGPIAVARIVLTSGTASPPTSCPRRREAINTGSAARGVGRSCKTPETTENLYFLHKEKKNISPRGRTPLLQNQHFCF
ncbi:unnamed protein product [Pleuronectes platessa]|uniref:Uncharacterized protein n=1 Tax=Pleuronectes platessa TaxID=8262 RepID=A0A9N7YC19_PLEPL|nr:unnamed protein product [Pleuronectes platessa]